MERSSGHTQSGDWTAVGATGLPDVSSLVGHLQSLYQESVAH